MENAKLLLIKQDILKLSKEILEASFHYCRASDVHLSSDASRINNAAHSINKLISEIDV
jgi:hypothetical protein